MLDTSLSLLEQLRARDSDELWSRFVGLYKPLIQSWMRSHANLPEADVDDLVQEVLLTVTRELPAFDHNGNPGAFRCWLRRILANRMRDLWRERGREPQPVGGSAFLQQLAELEDDASAASQLWDRQHDLHVMHQLLEALRPRFAAQTWQAFRFQVVDGLPPDEVARRLDLSVNSVYVAKSRVLNALRQAAAGVLN